MEEENIVDDERIHFVKSARVPCYGTSTSVSTSNPQSSNKIFCCHTVDSSDTLAGIAVKYGVTVQDIKSANQMWTNDSLFMYKTLLVPVSNASGDKVSLPEVKGCSQTEDLNCKSSKRLRRNISLHAAESTDLCDKLGEERCRDDVSNVANLSQNGRTVMSSMDVNKITAKDYFSAFDEQLHKLKKDVLAVESKQSLSE